MKMRSLPLQVHFRAALVHHQAQVLPGDEGELAGLPDPGRDEHQPAQAAEHQGDGINDPGGHPEGRGQLFRQRRGLLAADGFGDDLPENHEHGRQSDHGQDLSARAQPVQEKHGHQDGVGRGGHVGPQQGGGQQVFRPGEQF